MSKDQGMVTSSQSDSAMRMISDEDSNRHSAAILNPAAPSLTRSASIATHKQAAET
jgi:hypothetical protein